MELQGGTTHNPIVARRQRSAVAFVQSWTPKRPILVQPLRAEADQVRTRWAPLESLPPNAEIWTRGIGLNELVFDFDVAPWARVAEAGRRLTEAMDALSFDHVKAASGGKGAHVHGWIDPESVKLPTFLFNALKRWGVDPWREVRWVVANALIDAAGWPTDEEDPDGWEAARWAPPHGRGVFDKTKLRWDGNRKGSMVRAFGCVGRNGFRKTVLPSWDENPTALPLKFPEWREVAPWRVPRALQGRIIKALAEAVRIKRRALDGPALEDHANHPYDLGKRLKSVPCAAAFVKNGAPHGARHYSFLNLVTTCRALGYSKEAAQRFVRQALAACNLPESDKAAMIPDEVYSPAWELRTTCPSPNVNPELCCANKCALSRKGWN